MRKWIDAAILAVALSAIMLAAIVLIGLERRDLAPISIERRP